MSGVNAHAILQRSDSQLRRIQPQALVWQKTRLYALPQSYALAAYATRQRDAEVVSLLTAPRLAGLKDFEAAGQPRLAPTLLVEAAAAAQRSISLDSFLGAQSLEDVNIPSHSSTASVLRCRVALHGGVVEVVADQRTLLEARLARVSASAPKTLASGVLATVINTSQVLQQADLCHGLAAIADNNQNGFVCHPAQSAAAIDFASLQTKQPGLLSAMRFAALGLSTDSSKDSLRTGILLHTAMLSTSGQEQCSFKGIQWSAVHQTEHIAEPSVLYQVEWSVSQTSPQSYGKAFFLAKQSRIACAMNLNGLQICSANSCKCKPSMLIATPLTGKLP